MLFPEEPLHLSGEQGFGFFPAHAGLLLNNGRYEILRKLGRGQYFTTWLVSDSRCVAIEYLIPNLTRLVTPPEKKKHQFITPSKYLLSTPPRPIYLSWKFWRELKCNKLPYLFDHFETEGQHGKHLCLVLPVLSADVGQLRRSAPSKRLGFPTVKIIIAQVLEALVALHGVHIVHTGE